MDMSGIDFDDDVEQEIPAKSLDMQDKILER